MPTWRLRVRGDPSDQLVTAARLEVTAGTYTWWSVVMVLHDARWACVRRISTGELISVEQLQPQPRG